MNLSMVFLKNDLDVLQHYLHKPSGTKATQIYKKNATFDMLKDDQLRGEE